MAKRILPGSMAIPIIGPKPPRPVSATGGEPNRLRSAPSLGYRERLDPALPNLANRTASPEREQLSGLDIDALWQRAEAAALPFQPKSFDFVAIFSALHHFSDPASVLKKAAMLMRSGAFMAVMCEPVGLYRGQPDEECMGQKALGVNEQRFSLAEYDRMFHDAGLEAVSAQVDHDSLKCILQLQKQ